MKNREINLAECVQFIPAINNYSFKDLYYCYLQWRLQSACEWDKQTTTSSEFSLYCQACTSKMHFTQIILLNKTITSAEEETTPVNLLSMCEVCKLISPREILLFCQKKYICNKICTAVSKYMTSTNSVAFASSDASVGHLFNFIHYALLLTAQ